MTGDRSTGPARATVVEHHRLRHDIAVVRLIGDYTPFRAGQSLAVTVPQSPRLTRRYCSALPPSLDGKLEFHVRAVPAGWVSGSIVADTRPGDVWTVDAPEGALHVDDSGRDVVMIAGGTGLAPLRSLILDIGNRPNPPRVHLLYGGRSPRELYASDMLWYLVQSAPWLWVTPVVDRPSDPPFPDEWFYSAERSRRENMPPGTGFGPQDYAIGRVAEVAARYGPFTDHQVLVCGSPAMVDASVRTLTATGTPLDSIRI